MIFHNRPTPFNAPELLLIAETNAATFEMTQDAPAVAGHHEPCTKIHERKYGPRTDTIESRNQALPQIKNLAARRLHHSRQSGDIADPNMPICTMIAGGKKYKTAVLHSRNEYQYSLALPYHCGTKYWRMNKSST